MLLKVVLIYRLGCAKRSPTRVLHGPVVTDIQVHGDPSYLQATEAGSAFKGRAQQRGIRPVRASGDAADGDAFPPVITEHLAPYL